MRADNSKTIATELSSRALDEQEKSHRAPPDPVGYQNRPPTAPAPTIRIRMAGKLLVDV